VAVRGEFQAAGPCKAGFTTPDCGLENAVCAAIFPRMSTLAEIEEAVENLPRPQQETLLHYLADKLAVPLQNGGTHRSFFDAAKGYLGMFDGPADLSTNPRHLDDFGK
jgi:hypothetical protein